VAAGKGRVATSARPAPRTAAPPRNFTQWSLCKTVGPGTLPGAMNVARCLEISEYDALLAAANRRRGPTAPRDVALLTCLRRTGYRIHELLAVQIGDLLTPAVRQAERKIRPQDLPSRVAVRARYMKGGKRPRTVVLHDVARKALAHWLECLRQREPIAANWPVWIGQTARRAEPAAGRATAPRSITRQRAWQIVHELCRLAGIDERNVGLHSFRRLFVEDVLRASGGSMRMAQIAIGHTNQLTTERYARRDQAQADRCILAVP